VKLPKPIGDGAWSGYQSPDGELVDVTGELVALFHPSEKVPGRVKSCREQKPLPIEEIKDDMD
jgi:hypothetical protein